MTFMNEFTLSFSYQYSNVLQLVSIVTYSMLYFYILWLTGTSIYCYYLEFFRRDDASSSFAKLLLKYPLKKISFPIVLGIIPFFVLYSVDLIWLKGDEFNSLHNWSLINIILFIISVFILHSYNSTFELINVLSNSIDKQSQEYLDLMEKSLKRHKRSALFGMIGMILNLLLFSILSIAKLDYIKGDFRFEILAYLFDYHTFVRFGFFLVISFALVFLVNLFLSFSWEEEKLNLSEGIREFIKSKSLNSAIVTFLLLPLFILTELLIFPKNSLSGLIFLSSGLVVILAFIILNQLNAYNKESISGYLRFSFYISILVLISISIRDVVAIGNILKPKTVEISEEFVTYQENLKSKLNIKTVSFNGEDIFTAKCTACHKFDSKLVGPPYNVVLKKYENSRDQLVKFILNPVKVDPSYPPMPSQGLIPPEAEAVADYILKVYKENVK